MALGTISFAGSLPTLFLMLPAGVIADRVPKRSMLIATQMAMMLLAFALALLTGSGHLQVWMIAVIAALNGVANSFDAPARLALPVDLVDDRRDLQNAIALNATMFNLARVIGPAIGGVTLAALGAAWCFGLNGLSFMAVIIALLSLRIHEVVQPKTRDPLAKQLREGLHYVWETPVVRSVVALVAVSSLFAMSYGVLLPAYAADILLVDEKGLGALNAAVGVGALVGALAAATMSRNPNKGMQVTVGSLMFPAGLLGLAFTRSFPVALVLLGFVGFGFVTQNAVSNTLVQSMVPDALRGRVMSIYSLMFFGPSPFGALMAGALAQRLGVSAAVAICAGITLAFAAGLFVLAPSFRRTQTEVAPFLQGPSARSSGG
jgi:MFS family permease